VLGLLQYFVPFTVLFLCHVLCCTVCTSYFAFLFSVLISQYSLLLLLIVNVADCILAKHAHLFVDSFRVFVLLSTYLHVVLLLSPSFYMCYRFATDTLTAFVGAAHFSCRMNMVLCFLEGGSKVR
jgi:hypothetical protein